MSGPFAGLYLHAHDAFVSGESHAVPRPWRLAFTAPDHVPALRHVLLGIKAATRRPCSTDCSGD